MEVSRVRRRRVAAVGRAGRIAPGLLLGLVLGAGALRAESGEWRDGDLVLVALKGAAGSAISGTTGSPVSHIGLAAVHGSGRVSVVHAWGKVREDPLERFLELGTGEMAVRRVALPEVARAEVLAAARALLGKPYDRAYRMDNDSYYCSELVYRALADGPGRVPVALSPMDFTAGGPEAWEFWVRFFQGQVPQGLPGISPGDYYSDPDLETVRDDFGSAPAGPAPR